MVATIQGTVERQVVFDFREAQRRATQIQESRALLKVEVEKLGDAQAALEVTAAGKALAKVGEQIKARRAELLKEDDELQELMQTKKAAAKKAKATKEGQRVKELKDGVDALSVGIATAQRELAEGVANGAK